MSQSDDFLRSLQATTSKDWNAARKTRDPFAPLDVPDGTYHMRLTSVKLGKHKKEGYPQITFMFVIVNPEEYASKQTTVYHGIKASDNQTVGQKLERVFQDLQRLGIDTDNMEMAELPQIAATLSKQKPLVNVSISSGKKGQFKNIQGLVDSDEYDDDESEVPDAELPPEDEYDDDDDDIDVDPDEDAGHDDEPEEDEDSEPESEPEQSWNKGDECDYKPPRKRKPVACTVTTSNKTKRTVTLKNDETGDEYKGVSWDDLIDVTG